MAEPTETPPVIEQPAPSTVLPKLDGITQEDLSREIRGDPKPQPGDSDQPPARHVGERALEGFGDAAKEMMKKKAEEAKNPPEEKEEPEQKPAKKEVVSADDAPPPKKDDAPAERLSDDQLGVQPHDKPLTRRRIEQLLKDKADLAKERDEARALAKANPTASNVEEFNKLKEEHQKASDELLKFRRRYEIDNDETFKKTYDEPVAHAEAAIEGILKKYQLGDATLKAIKDEGGFAAFSRSSKTFPIIEKDPETGEPKTVHRTAAELARGWVNGIAVADGESIRAALGKQSLLSDEKKVAMERMVGESKQFFEKRQKEEADRVAATQKETENKSREYLDWVKKTTETTDWLKDREIPSNATADQKAKIEEHNKANADIRAKLAGNPTNMQEYTAMKLDAAHAHHLRREVSSRDERIKSLEAQVAKLQGGLRTTPKGGSLLSDSGKAPKKDDGVAPDDFKGGFRKAAQARMSGGDDE